MKPSWDNFNKAALLSENEQLAEDNESLKHMLATLEFQNKQLSEDLEAMSLKYYACVTLHKIKDDKLTKIRNFLK